MLDIKPGAATTLDIKEGVANANNLLGSSPEMPLQEEPKRSLGRNILESFKVGFGDDPGKVEYLKKTGKFQDVAINDKGQLVVKENNKWKFFNKPGPSISDIGNIPGHAVVGIPQTIGAGLGLAAGASTLNPWLAFAGGAGGGAVGGAVGETARQMIGKKFGTQSQLDPGSIATEATVGGLSEVLAFPFVKSSVMKKAAAKTAAQIVGIATDKSPELVERLITKGISNVVKPEYSFDAALKKQKNMALNALDAYLTKKNITPLQVKQMFANYKKTAVEGLDDLFKKYGDELTEKVANFPEIGQKPIKIDDVVAFIDNKIKQMTEGLAPEAKAQFSKDINYLTGIKNTLAKTTKEFMTDPRARVAENSMKEVHKVKQFIGATNAFEGQTGWGKETAQQVYGLLDDKLTSVDDVYKAVNKKLTNLFEIKNQIKTFLEMGKEGASSEKRIAKAGEQALNVQEALKNLSDQMPGDKQFFNKLQKFLNSTDYKIATRMEDVLDSPSSLDALERIMKESLGGSYSKKQSDYQMLRILEKVIKSKGKPFLEKTKDVVASKMWKEIPPGPLRALFIKPLADLLLPGTEALSKVAKGTVGKATSPLAQILEKNPTLGFGAMNLLMQKYRQGE